MMVYTADSSDTWGTARKFGDPQMLLKDVREMFILGFSFNFYMFHGGTNFGLIGGASSSNGYLPVVTSYDYCAVLTESGEYTDVSTVTRPKATNTVAYKQLILLHFLTLWDVLPHLDQPAKSVKPLSMEQLPVNQGDGQSFGYTLYETTIGNGGLLTTKGHIQDRGQVFLDNKYIGVLDRVKSELLLVKNPSKKTQILRILVENLGRLSSGLDINKERKGLTGDIYLDKTPLRQFRIYSLEMKNAVIQTRLPKFPDSWKVVTSHVQGPAFFLSHLRAGDPPQDTFINVKGWRKGVIFINGQTLGRYWNIGPQETLYVPAAWLHPGINEIIIFEELKGGIRIYFSREAKLGH